MNQITNPESARDSHVVMDFKAVQLAFSMGMGFGFFILSETAYSLSKGLFGLVSVGGSVLSANPAYVGRTVPIVACFLTIVACVLIGLRFFWAVTNVRRFSGEMAVDSESTKWVRKTIVIVHAPVLPDSKGNCGFECSVLQVMTE